MLCIWCIVMLKIQELKSLRTNDDQKNIKLEDKILRQFFVSCGNVLDNEELINPLQESNAGDVLAVPGQKSE